MALIPGMEGVDLGTAASDFISTIMWVGVAGVIILTAVLVFWKGLLAKRDVTVILDRSRAGGVKREIFKGRDVVIEKEPKFEIKTSFFGRLNVNRFPEDVVAEGNIVEGVLEGDEIRWCKPGISNLGEAELTPLVPQGARGVFYNLVKANFERRNQEGKLDKFILPGAIIVAGVIVAIIMWFGFSDLSKSFAAVSDSNYAFANKLLSNSTVVIQKQTTTTPNIINQPQVANAPPG